MDPTETSATNREPAVFADFFEASYATLFRAMYLLTGNRHEAEDIAQEAFVRVIERWDRVSAMERREGYLYRTALNIQRNRWRRTRRTLRTPAAREADQIDDFAMTDERDVVARALARLAPRQRTAIVLTEFLDYSSEQAAEVMRVKAGTVRALVHQGRNALREALGGRDG